MADYATLAAELRALEEKVETLNRRDGPQKMSAEWKLAVCVLESALVTKLPTLLAALQDAERYRTLKQIAVDCETLQIEVEVNLKGNGNWWELVGACPVAEGETLDAAIDAVRDAEGEVRRGE